MKFNVNKISLILIISVVAGQIIKIPLIDLRGPSALDITIIFLSLLGVYKFLRSKTDTLNLPNYFYFLLLFLFFCIFSLILNPLSLNINQILISSLYFFRLFFFVLVLFFCLKKILVFNTDLIFILSGLVLSILGILQFLFIPDLRFLSYLGWDPHYFRAVSTFFDPNFLGGFLTLCLLSCFLFDFKQLKIKYIFLLLMYACLALTFSRSSYLFFFISFFTLGILTKSKKIIFSSLLLFIVLLVIFYIYQVNVATPRNIDRIQSAQNRLDTWTQGITLFQKHPLFGVGFNSYKYALTKYNLADNTQINTRGSASNDASLLFILSTTGILGFGAFLAFIISILYKCGMEYRKSKTGQIIFCGLIGLLTASIFANSLFYPAIVTWLILYLGSLDFTE